MTKQERESERIRQEAIQFLRNWNDEDPKGFEAEQMRIFRDLESRGLK